jgi:hypothetical protein
MRAAVKISKIRAASQRDVLAVVHLTAVWQCVGRGAPSQMRALLEQLDLETRLNQHGG